eukprot:352301_1
MGNKATKLTWKCNTCTFENDLEKSPNQCSICNKTRTHQSQNIESMKSPRQTIIKEYRHKYGAELLSFFYPYPNKKGCNSTDAVQCIIDDKIYLSGSYIAQNMEWLKYNKIGAILNCAATNIKHCSSVYTDKCDIILKQLPINDTSKDKNIMNQYINDGINFINECIEEKKLKILVHCSAGMSRSATVLIAYLMKRNQWDLLKTFKFVRSKRKYVYPNLGFWQLLIEMNNSMFNRKDDNKQQENNDDNKQENNVKYKNNQDKLLSMDILEVHAETLGETTGFMYSSDHEDKVQLW